MKLYQHAKNKISSIYFGKIVNLKIPNSDWHRAFWAAFLLNFCNQLSAFVNLYQHAKSQTISSICSAEIVDMKILHSDWLRGF